jgi:Tfp pilus assembly protein FimT
MNHKLRIINSKGTSLVELIVYMAMFSILLVMLLQMFTSILNAQLESQTTSDVAMDGRYILTRLTYDLRNSKNILTPSSFGSSGAGNALHLTGNGTDYTYSLSSGNILLTNNSLGSSGQLNSTNTTISSLSFTKVGSVSGGVTIQLLMTLNSKARKQTGIETKTFQTTIGTRQ